MVRTRTTPNIRSNAWRLGWRLIWAAANPFSGLSVRAANTGQWQPTHPYGLPSWWPFVPGSGQSRPLEEIELLQSASQPQELRRWHELAILQQARLDRNRPLED